MQTILPRRQLNAHADFWSVSSTFIFKHETLFFILGAPKFGLYQSAWFWRKAFPKVFFVVIRMPCRMTIPICLKVRQGIIHGTILALDLYVQPVLQSNTSDFQHSQVFAMHNAVVTYSQLLCLHYPWFYTWPLVLIICKVYSFIAPHIEMEEVILLQKNLMEFFFLSGEEIITHLLSGMIANIYFKNCVFSFLYICAQHLD